MGLHTITHEMSSNLAVRVSVRDKIPNRAGQVDQPAAGFPLMRRIGQLSLLARPLSGKHGRLSKAAL